MAVLCVGLCVMALSLLLASRLVDFKLDKPNKLHIVSSSIRQAHALSWYLIGVGVNTWLVQWRWTSIWQRWCVLMEGAVQSVCGYLG